MRHANNLKRKTTNDGRNRTSKSRKNQKAQRNETYKYLGILEANPIKQVEMKEKNKKEYLRRTRKLLETQLYCRKLIRGIKTWVVPLVRYSGPFLNWTREEFLQMNQRTRKLRTMHTALHPRDDIDYMYQEKKEEEASPALKITSIHRYDDSRIWRTEAEVTLVLYNGQNWSTHQLKMNHWKVNWKYSWLSNFPRK